MSPEAELQKGIWEALNASTLLAAAMGGNVRVYDRVPGGSPGDEPTLPYVTSNEGQANDDGDTCERDRFEIFHECHVWSEAVGQLEAMEIAAIIRDVLLTPFAVNNWNLVIAQYVTTRHLQDPDRITTHSIVTIRFVLDPA